jgi:hypothetical protein
MLGDRSGEIDPYPTLISSTASSRDLAARGDPWIGAGNAEGPVDARRLSDKTRALNVASGTSACLRATAVERAASGVKKYRQATADLPMRFVSTRLGIDGVLVSARRD